MWRLFEIFESMQLFTKIKPNNMYTNLHSVLLSIFRLQSIQKSLLFYIFIKENIALQGNNLLTIISKIYIYKSFFGHMTFRLLFFLKAQKQHFFFENMSDQTKIRAKRKCERFNVVFGIEGKKVKIFINRFFFKNNCCAGNKKLEMNCLRVGHSESILR